MAKHHNSSMLVLFGVSLIKISGLVSTRELTLGFPGYRNTKTSKLIHASSFQGFANWDFGTGEYMGLTLGHLGCRNTEIPKSKRPTLSLVQGSQKQNLGHKVLHRILGKSFTRFGDQIERPP
jgi:hypothetical protein